MHVLVTGATGGLGKSVCRALADEGHNVKTWKFVPGGDGGVIDFTLRDVQGQAGGKPLDAIVHCAGAELIKPLRLMTDGDWDWVMSAPLIAMGLLRAAASRGVMAKGGSVTLVSSVAAERGTPGMAAYSASKAATEALARSAAVELAPMVIRVNCVRPGAFSSPMHKRITDAMSPEGISAYADKHPLGFGKPDDVVQAIMYLLTAPWVTGTVLTVDGGLLA